MDSRSENTKDGGCLMVAKVRDESSRSLVGSVSEAEENSESIREG